MFAIRTMTSGDPLLCEKPLALYNNTDAHSYGAGMNDILPGTLTDFRKLALLQQLVGKVASNESLCSKFFRLHVGNASADPKHSNASMDIFNGYTALPIIKPNAHIIFPRQHFRTS